MVQFSRRYNTPIQQVFQLMFRWDFEEEFISCHPDPPQAEKGLVFSLRDSSSTFGGLHTPESPLLRGDRGVCIDGAS